jgi:P-type E1-E2 ATPase
VIAHIFDWPLEDAVLTSFGLFLAFLPKGTRILNQILKSEAIEKIVQERILVADPSMLEKIGNVSTIIFDKTGVLTTQRMVLRDLYTQGG